MDIQGVSHIFDQIDEIVYISDLTSNELLYLNRYGCQRFGVPAPGTKCYEHLQGMQAPCEFCTNKLLMHCHGQRHTWVRQHPTIGSVLLHDSIIDYVGRPCRMELAIDVNKYVSELIATQSDLAAGKKLIRCIERLVVERDFGAAVNFMLKTIIEHYAADRAYIFEFDWTKEITNNTYEICKEGVIPEIKNLQNVPIEAVAVWVDIFKKRKKKVSVIKDVDNLKNNPDRRIEYEYLKPQGVKSLIAVPIMVDGELYGFLGVDNPNANMDMPELLTQATYIASTEFQKRILTDELTFKSRHDPMTGLQNRLAYDETISRLRGEERAIGAGFLDMNGLKWTNDNLGYEMGNKAIRRAGELIRKYVSEQYIYRISGDEFVIIWPDVSYTDFSVVAEKLETALVVERNIASMGYAWGIEEDIEVAVHKAEQLMQTAKRRLYSEDDSSRGRKPDYLDGFMKELRDGRFVAFLQPLYSIKRGCVYGAEVLVRKVDSHGGIHAPVEFIRVMEKEHIISAVDLEMLRQACELVVKWKDLWPDFVLNVNFSRSTLIEPNYLTQVDEIFASTGADPSKLVFEITESSQGIQLEPLSCLFDELKERGITIAIDDFGTEAACLEMLYLPQLSIAKIDRSLICKAENSIREQTIIRRMVDLCHELGMSCIAEGIETQSQVELLKKLNCDRIQGYYIGKPVPTDEFFERFCPVNAADK